MNHDTEEVDENSIQLELMERKVQEQSIKIKKMSKNIRKQKLIKEGLLQIVNESGFEDVIKKLEEEVPIIEKVDLDDDGFRIKRNFSNLSSKKVNTSNNKSVPEANKDDKKKLSFQARRCSAPHKAENTAVSSKDPVHPLNAGHIHHSFHNE